MAEVVAKEFTEFYYSTFDQNRAELANLYRETSMLTWEGTPIQGGDSIVKYLVGLPFDSVVHQITTLDTQPSSASISSLLVSVTGFLVVDGSENPLRFSQTFQLMPDDKTYYVFNDIFRLNYG